MSPDPTEAIRRALLPAVNAGETDRASLEGQYGQVWNTEELKDDFDVIGFMAPFVIVRRRSDSLKGSLMFRHNPRFYFCFHEDHA